MLEFLAWLAAFAAPIGLLLFATVRTRKRVTLPLEYFTGGKRPSPAALFLRTLKARADLLFDLGLAILAALAYSTVLERPSGLAFVVDGSRSMLTGSIGERPLDKAFAAILSDPESERARVFLLASDPRTLTPGLIDLTKDARKARASEPASSRASRLAAAAETRAAFLGLDPDALNDPRLRKTARVVFVTDALPTDGGGLPGRFEVVTTGRERGPWLMPTRTAFVPEAGVWRTAVVAGGGAEAATPTLFRIERGKPVELKADEYRLERAAYGYRISLPAPGLYAIKADSDAIPFVAPPGPFRPKATGALAEAMAGLFSFLPEAGPGFRPLAFASDGAPPVSGRGFTARSATGAAGSAASAAGIADPGAAYGATIAAGYARDGVALDARGRADDELPLLFWAALNAERADGIAPDARGLAAKGGAKRYGDGYVAGTWPDAAAIAPPVAEYSDAAPAWEFRERHAVDPTNRLWALALLSLYGAKLAFVAARKRKRPA